MSRTQWFFLAGMLFLVGTNLLGAYFATATTYRSLLQILLGAVVLTILYGAMSIHIDSLEKTVRGLENYIHRSFSAPTYSDTEHSVRGLLVNAIKDANTLVYAVGGRARDEAYLSEIQCRVQAGVDYTRVILGHHILHPMHAHLLQLMEQYQTDEIDASVRIAWLPAEKYGNFTVTDSEVLFSGPNPAPKSPLQSILQVTDASVAARYREYASRLYSAGHRVSPDSRLLSNLCLECSNVQDQIQELDDRVIQILVSGQDPGSL